MKTKNTKKEVQKAMPLQPYETGYKVRFDTNKKDTALINKIAARAYKEAEKIGSNYEKMDILMDLSACVSNGCPLRLAELLEADKFNFCHDIFGIRGNLDRTTGKLENCFLPRFAARKTKGE